MGKQIGEVSLVFTSTFQVCVNLFFEKQHFHSSMLTAGRGVRVLLRKSTGSWVATETGVTCRSAKSPAKSKMVLVDGADIDLTNVKWEQFSELDKFELDQYSSLTKLHAEERDAEHAPNNNSIVVWLDLGTTSILLTCDADSGSRGIAKCSFGCR